MCKGSDVWVEAVIILQLHTHTHTHTHNCLGMCHFTCAYTQFYRILPRRPCDAALPTSNYDNAAPTARGFEPLRAEPNGFLVHHLNHSVTLSW